MRLFIALPLPDFARQQAEGYIAALRAAVKNVVNLPHISWPADKE